MTEETNEHKFEWSKKKIIMAIIFLIIAVVSVYVFVRTILDEKYLFEIIRDYFIVPLLELGFWAVFVFLFLMILQSLIAPIPSELILLSGAMIFGLWKGVIVGVIGSMLSAIVTFYISNKGGRAILEATGEKIGIAQKMIMIMDEWIEKWGIWAIIVGRAVPLIMFDPVSYAAGISNIKPKQYYIATFIGSIPRAIFFAILGIQLLGDRDRSEIKYLTTSEIEEISSQFNTIFFVIFGVLVLMLVLANVLVYFREKKKNQS
jgi:uncharacterized membrane protein YdjX (TVP38/TMEM64 family)